MEPGIAGLALDVESRLVIGRAADAMSLNIRQLTMREMRTQTRQQVRTTICGCCLGVVLVRLPPLCLPSTSCSMRRTIELIAAETWLRIVWSRSRGCCKHVRIRQERDRLSAYRSAVSAWSMRSVPAHLIALHALDDVLHHTVHHAQVLNDVGLSARMKRRATLSRLRSSLSSVLASRFFSLTVARSPLALISATSSAHTKLSLSQRELVASYRSKVGQRSWVDLPACPCCVRVRLRVEELRQPVLCDLAS